MRQRGQSAIESCLVVAMVVISVVALSLYLKYAAAGRMKATADELSLTLLNPNNSQVGYVTCRTSTSSPSDGFNGGGGSTSVNEQSTQRTILSGTLGPLPLCPWE